MLKSNSFESLMPYLFTKYLKNSIPTLLRYVILAQRNPILHPKEANGCIDFWLTVTILLIGVWPLYLHNENFSNHLLCYELTVYQVCHLKFHCPLLILIALANALVGVVGHFNTANILAAQITDFSCVPFTRVCRRVK